MDLMHFSPRSSRVAMCSIIEEIVNVRRSELIFLALIYLPDFSGEQVDFQFIFRDGYSEKSKLLRGLGDTRPDGQIWHHYY